MTIEQAKQTITNSTLPADIKAQALENLEKYPIESNTRFENKVAIAIDHFEWMKTDHGYDPWRSIFIEATRGEFDPVQDKFMRGEIGIAFNIGQDDPPAESMEEIGGIEFFRRLKSIPNFTAKNIRLKLNDGWVTIGEIRVTTDNSPSQPD